jgi:hypothetical protein
LAVILKTTMNIKMIIEIFRLLRPKYYNILTRILVVGGLALLSKPIWVDILNVFFMQLNFSLIGEYDWLVGLVVILIALIYNTVHKYLDLKYEKPNEPAFYHTENKTFSDFGELCQEILPILRDNEYIFKTTGPNSGQNNTGELRTDLTMWEELKREVIKPNNEAIKELINKNSRLIPSKYDTDFKRMVLHIDSFQKHIENPNFDYSEFQFPSTFPEIIMNCCFDSAKNDKGIYNKLNWLSKKMKAINPAKWIAFGSSILTPNKTNDFDIAILLDKGISLKEANRKIDSIRFDFKVKFKQPLHITIFEDNNKDDFSDFLALNPLKIERSNG